MTTTTPAERDGYNALTSYPKWVKSLLSQLDDVGWKTGITSDKRGRGTAINVDVFSYDEKQRLAVVQVRQCQFHPNRYSRVRRNYYLVGTNENGIAFAHAVDSPPRSSSAMAYDLRRSLIADTLTWLLPCS